MEEKKSSRVEVKDVEADVMAEMLRLVPEKIKVMIHLHTTLKTENCPSTCLQKKDGPFHNQVVLYFYTCIGNKLFKAQSDVYRSICLSAILFVLISRNAMKFYFAKVYLHGQHEVPRDDGGQSAGSGRQICP